MNEKYLKDNEKELDFYEKLKRFKSNSPNKPNLLGDYKQELKYCI